MTSLFELYMKDVRNGETRLGFAEWRDEKDTRWSAGENNSQSYITEDMVVDMRTRHANGERISSIIEDYSELHDDTVRKIVHRHCWKHLDVDTGDGG